jgi:hypothetical protein
MKNKLMYLCVILIMVVMSGCARQDTAGSNSKIAATKNNTVGKSFAETDTNSTTDASKGEVSTKGENAENGEITTDGESSISGNETTSEDNQAAIMQSLNQLEGEDVASQTLPQESSTTQATSSTNQGVDPKSYLTLNYNCNIEEDRKNFNEDKLDITVGDDYYATQINDWYVNFDQYKGKTVEIEGYYIADYLPYLFVGRFGPTCPYCQGAYVCFEFYTKEDLSHLVSGKDWIKVKGILREDKDESGTFNYIEVMSIEKMDQVGKDTVTN